ncbi:MBL fold metallo-hydrolase [Sulfitobacter sp.]|uniref:MBL fold metallo-hydrolase n=1 Tax=Sulfitobacter sp. TaxID=1903071 RepID=UPI00405991C6
MTHGKIKVFAAGCALLALAAPVLAESDPELSAKHVAAAEAAAGSDLTNVLGNCKKIGKSFTVTSKPGENALEHLIAKGDPRPFSVFDNLHFLGTEWVSAWAIETSDGIILFDTLNNNDEAKAYIEDGLVSLGLDPADIRKIIVAHSHGDHYGAAVYLKEKYGAEIIMSDADWNELEKDKLQFDNPLWGPAPKRDVTVNDGDTVTLGDTSVKILVTPGHTPGTISAIVPLKDGDETHNAIVWGGNGLNWGKIPERFVSMMDSQARIADMAEEEKIDVFLSNHGGLDATHAKIDQIEAGGEEARNPFVIGEDGVKRAMTAMRHCVAAQLASFDPAAVPAD